MALGGSSKSRLYIPLLQFFVTALGLVCSSRQTDFLHRDHHHCAWTVSIKTPNFFLVIQEELNTVYELRSEVDMPVFFYIDPEFAEDPKLEHVNTITLSYTFFEAREGLQLSFQGYPRSHDSQLVTAS